MTEASGAVLRGERTVMLRHEAVRAAKKSKRSSAGVELPAEALGLFEQLREWRSGVAREQGVPAYIVFGDATLRGIALTKTRASLEELGTISGVGEKKLDDVRGGIARGLVARGAGRLRYIGLHAWDEGAGFAEESTFSIGGLARSRWEPCWSSPGATGTCQRA